MSEPDLSRRRLCTGLLAAAALPALLQRPAWASPEPAAVRFDDFDWFDAARQRPVPVRLYQPGSPGAAALPLVVFSHGIGGSRRGYSYLGRFWAAQGFASLHLQHVGSDRGLWGGNPFTLLGRLHGAAADQEAAGRAHDFRFALDHALAGDAGLRIDPQRIVAAGHSYGANTAMLVSGARVERAGQALDLHDARVRAAMLLSAPPFYGEAELGRILQPLRVPSLHVTATEDTITIPGYYSDASDRLRVFEATGSPRKWLAVFTGGSHSIFTDRGGTGGVTLNPQVKEATQRLSLAFLRQVFDGDDQALDDWHRQHAPMLSQFSVGARGS